MNGDKPHWGAIGILILAAYLARNLSEAAVEPSWYKYVLCLFIFTLGGIFYNVDRISAWLNRRSEGEHEDHNEQG